MITPNLQPSALVVLVLRAGYVNPKSSACVAATLAQILTQVLFEPTSACVAATLAQTRTPVLFEQDRDELSQSAKAGRCGSSS